MTEIFGKDDTMNTINCSCGCQSGCQSGCGCGSGCSFNPCAVTCGGGLRREYGYVYNTTAQTVAQNGAVTFSGNGLLSEGIAHNAGDERVNVQEAGVYLVEFYVSTAAADRFTVYKNGEPVEGATFASNGEEATVGKAVVSAQRGDAFTVVNTGDTQATLEENQGAVNASVYAEKLF